MKGARPATTTTMRLGPQPGEVIDRSQPFTFRWNGAAVPAYAGDTIISALAAAGERIVSRSFKYHRPRGILTASFLDPGCLVQVGDEPNVRGAHRRAEPGMVVRAQNVWPSLRYDVRAINQAMGRMLPPGFYYKTFMAPRALWPVYQQMLRRFSPGGVVSAARREAAFDQRYAHRDVLVAGGGPAGMAAAIAAAERRAQVLLVEEEYDLGGHLRWGGEAERATLRHLRDAVAANDRIEALTNSLVTGRYDDNWVAIVQRRGGPVEEAVDQGARQDADRGAGADRAPLRLRGERQAGSDALHGGAAADQLVRREARCAGGGVDRQCPGRCRGGGLGAGRGGGRGGGGCAQGRDRGAGAGACGVQAVELGDGSCIEADLLVTAVGWSAPTALLEMAGGRSRFDPRAARFLPADLPDDVLAAGGIVGDGTLEQLMEQARAVGTEAARRAAARARWLRTGNPSAVLEEGRAAEPPFPIPTLPLEESVALFRSTTHGFVDFSEDVSSKDILAAVHEGYDSIELAKRYTTATMGPAQGKLELVNAVAIHATATGRSLAETGGTTARPPYGPVSLGALAGRIREPVSVSPMQGWHDRQRAKPIIAGQWIRPEHYGDPQAEVRNVRENVGLIDVTPLGKFDLRGPDVPRLLNYLYVNKWSKLEIGAVRYGVMCANDGVVLDDGVTGVWRPIGI